MARNTLTDMNNLLFEMAERILHPDADDKPVDLEQARTLCKIAETVIDNGRVQLEYIRLMDEVAPGAIQLPTPQAFLGTGGAA